MLKSQNIEMLFITEVDVERIVRFSSSDLLLIQSVLIRIICKQNVLFIVENGDIILVVQTVN